MAAALGDGNVYILIFQILVVVGAGGHGGEGEHFPIPPDVAQAAVARGMGEAQSVGEADRPHVHGRAAS